MEANLYDSYRVRMEIMRGEEKIDTWQVPGNNLVESAGVFNRLKNDACSRLIQNGIDWRNDVYAVLSIIDVVAGEKPLIEWHSYNCAFYIDMDSEDMMKKCQAQSKDVSHKNELDKLLDDLHQWKNYGVGIAVEFPNGDRYVFNMAQSPLSWNYRYPDQASIGYWDSEDEYQVVEGMYLQEGKDRGWHRDALMKTMMDKNPELAMEERMEEAGIKFGR